MASPDTLSMNVIPHFARLHEHVAIEEGLFDAWGLDVTLHSMEAMNQHGMYEHAFEDPDTTDAGPNVDTVENAVNSACAWGVACNAGAGTGRFVPEPYIASEQVLAVAPETDVHSPADLANVPIGVSAQSGTHFGSLLALESVLDPAEIEFEFVGTPREAFEAFLEGEVRAANLMGPYPYMADQRGYRRVAEQTIPVLFYVTGRPSEAALERYFAALEAADDRLRADPAAYKQLWSRIVPAEFRDHDYDYGAFGVGELLRFEPFPREEFEDVVAFVEKWGMDGGMATKDYDELVIPPGAD